MKTTLVIISIIICIAAFTACSKLLPSMINPENGLCRPIDLSNAQAVLFAQGNDQFFAIRTAATGLGLILFQTVVAVVMGAITEGIPSLSSHASGKQTVQEINFWQKGASVAKCQPAWISAPANS